MKQYSPGELVEVTNDRLSMHRFILFGKRRYPTLEGTIGETILGVPIISFVISCFDSRDPTYTTNEKSNVALFVITPAFTGWVRQYNTEEIA